MFGALKKVLDDYGILYVSDEVQTGWGRTGEHFWGYEAHGLIPDLLTFAKGLGNGLALAGVIGRGEIVDDLPANSISTFGGNPLVTAGGIANLRYLLDNDLQANALVQGRRILERLRPLAEALDVVGEVRGKGLLLGIELVKDRKTKERAVDARNSLVQAMFKRGVLILGAGKNAVRLAPPLILSKDQADSILMILDESLGELRP
jgi:4-aminobutyrate aminotransferase